MHHSIVEKFIIVVIVVDDLAFAFNAPRQLNEFMSKLSVTFEVKLLGRLNTFIGWNISRHKQQITVNQNRYIGELLNKYGMSVCNGTLTLMDQNADISSALDGETILVTKENRLYRKRIGELLYLSICTKPDI